MIEAKPFQLEKAASLLEISEEALLKALEFNYEMAKILWHIELSMDQFLKNEISNIIQDIPQVGKAAAVFGNVMGHLLKNKEKALSIFSDEEFQRIQKRIGREIESSISDALKYHKHELNLSGLNLDKIPEKIGDLKQLENLNLWNNNLSELTPLRNLGKLKFLSLESNNISNINPIKNLTNLDLLGLSNNKISDIEPLRNLTNITILYLANNEVTNIEPLSNIRSLTHLDLNNNIIDESGLKEVLKIKNLRTIYLMGSGVSADREAVEGGMVDKLRDYYKVNLDANDSKFTSDQNSTIQESKVIPPISSLADTTAQEEKNVTETLDNKKETEDTTSKGKKPETTTTAEEEEEAKSFRTGKFSIMATPTDVLLDVKDLSTIFYDFIADCKYNSEQFFGLFGRWGRGKTYLWEYIKSKKIDTEKYSTVEFHAWKYQDTPGLWAYLYGELNRHFLQEGEEKKTQAGRFLLRTKNILKLNYTRGKILQPILFFIGSVLLSIILFIVNSTTELFNNKNILIPSILGLITINLAVFINHLKKYWNGAKQIVSQVTSNVDFRTHLGLQHEIQEELKFLLKAWIPEKKQTKKRILLFIDDIDRCSEDKIIQIVDYIRVLLNDKEIQERVTVLAAIDERILIHAIQNKYRKFVENKDNDATFKELCREYMDKLFLAGLKLGPLTGFEKEEMVEGFTKGYLKQEKKEESTPVLQTPQPLTKEPEIKVLGKDPRSLDPGKFPSPRMVEGTFKKSDIDDASTQENDEDIPSSTSVIQQENPADENGTIAYSLEKWEQDFLKEIIRQNTDATPRSIRVYTYRYLLGKKLIEKPLTDGKPSCDQWYNTKRAKKFFALNLFHYTYRSNVDELNSQYREFMKDYDDKKQVHVKLYNYPLSLNQELGSIMYQTLTMIVAY